MSYKNSNKVHLRKSRIEGNRIFYKKHGSTCGKADLGTYKIKDFKYYCDNFANEVCKNCYANYKDLVGGLKNE